MSNKPVTTALTPQVHGGDVGRGQPAGKPRIVSNRRRVGFNCDAGRSFTMLLSRGFQSVGQFRLKLHPSFFDRIGHLSGEVISILHFLQICHPVIGHVDMVDHQFVDIVSSATMPQFRPPILHPTVVKSFQN